DCGTSHVRRRRRARSIPHLAPARRPQADAGIFVLGGRRRRGAGRRDEPRCARGKQAGGAMKDFWLSCGHHLLDRDAGGGLLLTGDFLKVYLARPELTPPGDACVVEKTLHAALMADPRRPVSADEIAAISDADARENWQVMIAFRDLLARHKTLEAAHLDIVRTG